jgi:transcriptional regulator with XRE-family HTH domain
MTAKWIERLETSESGRRTLEQERLIMQATEAIASLMHEQEVTRADLARRIGKSSAFVTKILRGDNNFTLRTLSDLLFALDRSAHLTLGEIGEEISLCATRPAQTLRFDSSHWGMRQAAWPAMRRMDALTTSKEVAA